MPLPALSPFSLRSHALPFPRDSSSGMFGVDPKPVTPHQVSGNPLKRVTASSSSIFSPLIASTFFFQAHLPQLCQITFFQRCTGSCGRPLFQDRLQCCGTFFALFQGLGAFAKALFHCLLHDLFRSHIGFGGPSLPTLTGLGQNPKHTHMSQTLVLEKIFHFFQK